MSTRHLSPIEFLALARKRAQGGHLSVFRQLVEIAVLFPICGVGPGYYQLAAFWDKSTPWQHKTKHLSARAYRRRVNALNPPAYQKLSQNKLAEKAMLRLFHIPSSEYLGFLQKDVGRTVDGSSLTGPLEFGRFLEQRSDINRVCTKPVEGSGGSGVEVVDVLRTQQGIFVSQVPSRQRYTLHEYCARLEANHRGGTIVENYLVQHPALAQLNPSSVNTLRFWVLKPDTCRPRVVLGLQRIGREGSVVDNTSSGGLVAPVDLQTGVMEAAHDGSPYRRMFATHPDHGAQIARVQLPMFSESIQLALESIKAFPMLAFFGLDVAITPLGPRIIELNPFPDREGAADVRAPSRLLLAT